VPVISACRRTDVSRWRLLAAGLCLWLGLATLPAQAAALKRVTVAMSLTPLSAPVIIAKKNGYFAENYH
jgi:ABC-type nitrate/sulfonate/bicarbonate transport system substrate-binding protein